MRKPKVGILGSGLSGAFANRACLDRGIVPEVRTGRFHTQFPGAVYLHWIPESVTAPPSPILHLGIGTAETYFEKQFGKEGIEWASKSSFPSNEMKQFTGYNVQDCWEQLWTSEADITLVGAELSDTDIAQLGEFYDLIFLTFPTQQAKRAMAQHMHKVAIRTLPEGTSLPESVKELTGDYENFLLYNGEEKQAWVRMSSLWGKLSLEFPIDCLPDEWVGEQWAVRADLLPTAEPYTVSPAENVILVGRYARWDRKMLSHEAYQIVTEVLDWWEAQ